MNFLTKFILITAISTVPFAAADNVCESTFIINLENKDTNWPDPKDCKITRLRIKDSRPAVTNHDNPDPEEDLVGLKARFAPLSNLRGKLADKPKIAIEIQHIFTPSYNKNMNRINALLAVLDIQGAEFFGLAEKVAPPNSVAEKALIVATSGPLLFKAGKSIYENMNANENANVRSAFVSTVHALISITLQGALLAFTPKFLFVIASTTVTAAHDLLTTARFRTYHLVVFGVASNFHIVSNWFGREPLANAYTYCIGGKPFHIERVVPDDYMKEFHDSRLSPLCQIAFAQ